MTRVLATDVHVTTPQDGHVHLRAGTRERDVPKNLRDAKATRLASDLGDRMRGILEETAEPLLGGHVWIEEGSDAFDVNNVVAAGPSQLGEHPRAAGLVVKPFGR